MRLLSEKMFLATDMYLCIIMYRKFICGKVLDYQNGFHVPFGNLMLTPNVLPILNNINSPSSIHFSRYVSVCKLALSPETAISNNLDSILFPHNCQLNSALPLGCSLTIPIISNNSRYSSLLFGYEQETDMNRCTARWQSSCFIAVSFPEVKSRHADLDGKQSRYIDQFLHQKSRMPQKLAEIKLWCVSLLSPRIP